MLTPVRSGSQDANSDAPGGDRWCRVGDGNQAPLVAVHTWHSDVMHYEALSQALGDRPIFSVLPPKSDAGALPRRVDDWVDHVLAVLDELPVDPPYRVIGWSFGGVVALETARRLIAGGKPVAFVGMIDTIRPKLRPLSPSEYLWYHLGEALDIPDERLRIRYMGKKGLVYLHRRFPVAGGAAKRALRVARPQPAPEAKRPKPSNSKPRDPLKVSIHVSYLNYRGRGVDFPVSLYATAPSCVRAGGPALRWSGWLEAGYEFVMISGDHFSLFERGNVESFAGVLQRSLDVVEMTSAPVRDGSASAGLQNGCD